MNNVILIGRLTRDPELRTTANGTSTTSFSLAVDGYRNANGEVHTDFINIVVWNKQAENVCKFVKKGSQIAIQGRISTRSYDAQDGTKRYVTEVLADNVYFLESKGNQEGDSNFPKAPEMNQQVSNKKNEDDDYSYNNNVSFTDDDVPF